MFYFLLVEILRQDFMPVVCSSFLGLSNNFSQDLLHGMIVIL